MMLHLNPSRSRKAAARSRRKGKEAPVAKSKKRSRAAVARRGRSIKKASRKGRRSRSRAAGVSGFRLNHATKREFIETGLGVAAGAVVPGMVVSKFASSLPPQLNTASVRPAVDGAAGLVLAALLSRFAPRVARGVALGAVGNTVAQYALPHVQKMMGMSGYISQPAGVPLYGYQTAGYLAGGVGAGSFDMNAERHFINN